LLVDHLSIVSQKTGVVGVHDAYEFHLARGIAELSSSSSEKNTADANANGAVAEPNRPPLVACLMELRDPRESSNMHHATHLGSNKSLSGLLYCLSDDVQSRMVVYLASTQSSLLVSFQSQVGFIVKLMASNSSALLCKLAVKAIEKISQLFVNQCMYASVK
jgi:hypothetical protein